MSNSMTPERAIEILNPEHREHYDSIETVNEACRMGMVAIGYRIKKKPDYIGDGYDENSELIYDTWLCPNCEHEYEVNYDDYDYCPNCGQAIDWTDE